jgi:hypothetical protein
MAVKSFVVADVRVGTAAGVVIDSSRAGLLTQLDVDNVRVDGNTLSTTNTNGDLSIAPNGTGKVNVGGTGGARKFTVWCSGQDGLDIAGGIPEIRMVGGSYLGNCIMVSNRMALGTSEAWDAFNIVNGQMGVKCTAPQAPLHVAGDTTITGGVYTGGSTSAKGTLRVDASGNGFFATATVGGAKDWGKLTSAPSSPGESDTYYDTTLHNRRTWNATAWQSHW